MDDKKLDQMLREQAERIEEELPYQVEKRIDQTLEDLPDSVPDKPRGFWSTGMRYVLTGVASVIFVIIAFSYYQMDDEPENASVSPGEETEQIDQEFRYEEMPFDTEEVTERMKNRLLEEFPFDSVDNIKVKFSLSHQNRWIALARFNEEQFAPMTVALFELKGTASNFSLRFLTGKNLVPVHWYDKENNVGYGTINSVNPFVEKVRIQTENHQYISYVNDEKYIYVSEEKPEKVEFLTSEGTVLRTLETFNFDEQYPLIAQTEGKYGLLVVGDNRLAESGLLEKHGIRNVSNSRFVSSFEIAKERYDFLNLKKAPVYVVFDDKEMVYKTHNRNDLIKFLKEN
ncbi:hypothetical protein GWK91_16010 [Virgibacillus sp. MSP4-1]|uniref:hypothetical protein n=1 Tax=Virgibacillus sp. MSP4-1 TaxID=2700081 RepID=UPI0003A4FAE3|nr:hypothetical protein [Virgibacillus sp. MSP4-1]QHS24304.1 hypothetical protein GWK91_16010 [Virgibacillus sp. MSP4-1]